ncbi:MAG: DegT/DnrJ/EryC1/StrS family aminotransferase, partial [Clostridia bacterium]|nr:DegT/DnrJ/EryC1/StrS family aminotransferase [Clostridia bacterium]
LGKRLGTYGKAGALSFNYYKIVSSGEGGAILTSDEEIYERALIYQDSSAVAFFGDQMEGFEQRAFCGNEFRANELCAAVMNVQLSRLDGILEDLRANKKYIMDALKGEATFIPSNDIKGDCGTTVAFKFESEKRARAFAEAEGVSGTLPIDTGKHVYRHWDPIIKKYGAFNPLMDPFKMKANEGIIPDYSVDMCPTTLAHLSKVVYVAVDPDDRKKTLDRKIELYRKALKGID